MLGSEGYERILDLACATGGRSIEQRWDAPTRRLDGTRRSLVEFDAPEHAETVAFQRRLYTVEELAEIFEAVGLSLADVYDEHGAPCTPSAAEQQLYVEARG